MQLHHLCLLACCSRLHERAAGQRLRDERRPSGACARRKAPATARVRSRHTRRTRRAQGDAAEGLLTGAFCWDGSASSTPPPPPPSAAQPPPASRPARTRCGSADGLDAADEDARQPERAGRGAAATAHPCRRGAAQQRGGLLVGAGRARVQPDALFGVPPGRPTNPAQGGRQGLHRPFQEVPPVGCAGGWGGGSAGQRA